jgi:flagellar hook protein FlgE
MLRSMYSAISGMQSFETMLDVIGNNIANVDTPGFKAGTVDFSDVMSQTLNGGSAPNPSQGGTNPQQVGLGTKVSAISTNFADGAPQSTGNSLDLAIQGTGLFAVSPDGGTHTYLTRTGDFNLDSSNNLVLPNGAAALGYELKAGGGGTADTSGLQSVNLDNYLTSYVASLNGTTDPSGGNYGTATGNSITDSKGNTWTFTLASPANLQIGANGSLTATVEATETTATTPPTSATQSQPLTLGYLALGTVNNPGGMEKVGDSMYIPSNNSGPATYQPAGQNSTGTINADYLEMSNVDLTQEFSNMIVAQQGFTANSKMIGTDNAILSDIVNLKSTQ